MPVLGDVDLANYTEQRVWATASDGTRIPVSLVHRVEVVPDGTNPLRADRLRLVRDLVRPLLLRGPAQPARPWCRRGRRPRARWRGDGAALVRRRQAAREDEHLHRHPRLRRAPRRRGVGGPGPRRPRRWFCGRAARRCGAQPRSRGLPGGPRGRAVRRRPDDDAPARAAPDGGGVGGVGQPPRRPGGVRRDAGLRPVRERARRALPGGAGDLEPARHPGLRHRTREVGGPPPRDRDERPARSARCCCAPRSRQGTAGAAAGTPPGSSSPGSGPSSSTSSGRPSASDRVSG